MDAGSRTARRAAGVACLILLLAGCSSLREDRALERFVQWWPGEYDNLGSGAAAGGVPTRLHVVRTDLRAFGERTVYAEWRSAVDDRLLRQRIYAFSNEPDGRWRVALHVFPPPGDPRFLARTERAWSEPSRLDGLTPADMVELPGCDVLFEARPRRDGANTSAPTYEGAMKRRACSIPAPGVGRAVYSWTQMRRSADRFEYLDGWFFADDDSVYRRFSEDWYVFERVGAARD